MSFGGNLFRLTDPDLITIKKCYKKVTQLLTTADDDDESRFLDDFSGHGAESKLPYDNDVTAMTSHGHVVPGNNST